MSPISRDSDALLLDVADMRARLATERPTECLWALKNLRGGIVDIEFIAQYLTLKHAHAHGEILGLGTQGPFEALMKAKILDRGTGRLLVDALSLWQGLQGLLALTIEGELAVERENEISHALQEDLVKIGGASSIVKETFSLKHYLDSFLYYFGEAVPEVLENVISHMEAKKYQAKKGL